MAIEQHGEWKYSLVCDECGHEVKYFNTFEEAVAYKKKTDGKARERTASG